MRAKILTLGLICPLMLSSILSAEKKKEVKSWQDYFPDPVERIYIIMKDNTIFRATNNDEKRIYIGFGILERELKRRNYKIENIAIVIHNHFVKDNFSRSDYKQYWTLKSFGFDGRFLLYCHRTNKTYDIEDEGKSK